MYVVKIVTNPQNSILIHIIFASSTSPTVLLSITPSSPHPGPVLTVVLRGEWAEQQRGDATPRVLPLGPSGGCQSPVEWRVQVWCHRRQRLRHPRCHEVQREGVSWWRDEGDGLYGLSCTLWCICLLFNCPKCRFSVTSYSIEQNQRLGGVCIFLSDTTKHMIVK